MQTIKTPEEMITFGKNTAQHHKIVLLEWELGAGKTLFTKWFALGLWLPEQYVQSPTYTYLNIYGQKLLHIDMYRIKEYHELVEKWIIDQINEFDYIIIEWPKFIDKLPLHNPLHFHIHKTSETERSIEEII